VVIARDILLNSGEEERMMRKTFLLVVAVALMLGAAFDAGAQVRLDMDVNVPIYAGYTAAGTAEGAWNSYFIPFPDAKLFYQFSLGPVNLGAGVRVFTVIIENFLYPELYAELDLNPFVVSLNVGGLAFLEFGLLTSLLQGVGVTTLTGFHEVILPDLSVAYKVNDWFRICGGVFMISPFGQSLGGVLSNNVFAGYVSAKFIVMFK
jgi:hypothetical protein